MSILIVNNLKYHYEIVGDGPPLVLLHGFTGSIANWTAHANIFAQHFQVITVDLPGHGLSEAPADPARYAMAQVAADLIALLDTLTNQTVHLLGYSMGGRLALYTAITHTERFQSLILESASPGLQRQEDRAERRQRDEVLVARIEREGIDAFVDYWEALPLFASQRRLSAELRRHLRVQRLCNRPGGLVNSLRGMGTGAQPSLWEQLNTLNMPVLFMVGELDAKFVCIARQMYDLMSEAQIVIMPDSGHTIHLEQPAAFQNRVMNFLRGNNASF